MASSLFGSPARTPQGMKASSLAGGVNSQIKQAAQSAKRMMGMLSAAKNPEAAIMKAAQQNPQLNAVVQMCNGRNPQEVFKERCKQYGVNPDDAIKQIQQMLS